MTKEYDVVVIGSGPAGYHALSGAGNWDSVRRVSKSGKIRTKKPSLAALALTLGAFLQKRCWTPLINIEAQQGHETHGIKVSAVILMCRR